MLEKQEGRTALQPISADTRLAAEPESVSCDLAGEVIILNMKSGTYFGLNEVGAFIWKMIDQPRSVREICNFIAEEYEVDMSQCEEDVKQLAGLLADKGLIRLEQ